MGCDSAECNSALRGRFATTLRNTLLSVGLWLLASFSVASAMQWTQGAGFRSAEISPAGSEKDGFTLLGAAQTRIDFTNHLSDAKAAENQIRLNGSGVALGDIDGDGLCDIYLCRLEGSNALYRNLGHWRFEEVASSGGAGCDGQYSTGAALADIDGDSDLDLLVNGIGVGTRLFLNDGRGKFTELNDSGLVRRFGATTSALADIDGDGDLDLYVANYRTSTIRTTGFAVLNVGGKRSIRPEDRDHLEYTPEGRVLEHGEAHFLYRNDGGGHFTALPWTDGTFLDEDGKALAKPPFDWGLSAMFRDINGDGAPDVYVCNDFHSTDKVWINDGKGRFRALPRLALRKTSTFSMAVDFGDLNRDGLDDIFVADMLSLSHSRRLMQLAAADAYHPQVGIFEDRPQFDRNTLQLNRGDGTFAEIASYAGLEASEWTWSAMLLDVDLDGFEDILCSTGHMFDTQDLDAEARIQAKGPWRRDLIPQKLLMFPKMQQPKVAFRNRRDLTFEEMGRAWRFNQAGVAHGMALGDLDNDGDLDVVVNNLNGAAGIYRNDSSAPRIAVRLKGRSPNTHGIGARIKVYGGPVDQSQEMNAGGRYLSGDDPVRVFAAGQRTNDLRIEVTWRNGKRSVVEKAKANRIYEIDEAESAAEVKGPKSNVSGVEPSTNTSLSRITHHASPLFQDVSHLLNHTHIDEAFDDFSRQPLLPRKLSQLGPGVAWFDINNDGWEDLIIGSGRGGSLAVFLNDGKGGYSKVQGAPLNQIATRDQTGVIGWEKAPGQPLLLVGSANYEDGLANGGAARQYDWPGKVVSDAVPGQTSSSGPLAMADIDGDGDLDLFIGGRCLPGRWPEPATSLLLRNEGGRLEIDPQRSNTFARVGLISGSVFTDLNADGAPDLVLACEWGPLRIFVNDGSGRFSEATQRWGLDSFVGWWNGVAVGDFDGDGRMDLVASNWGLNSAYQTAGKVHAAADGGLHARPVNLAAINPALLYHGDFDGNGTLDLIEARFDLPSNKTVPIRSLNAAVQGMPLLRERFQTLAAFNEASVLEIGGNLMKQAAPLRATWLASTVFLNRGDRFELVLLPAEAQLAPAFGVSMADFDGDGNEDVFLSQNFFPVQPAASRLDAGRGLLLRGDGSGGFSSVPGQESGLMIYGEGRGSAVADYDGDGRVDLVVAQNGAATKLYHNLEARPGLRIRLKGPPANPSGVGAALRLLYGERSGPIREIHAGSGYWSQDSAAMVLGKSGEPTKLWVRWPGGRIALFDIPGGAREIIGGW
jgi:hypothetical protein